MMTTENLKPHDEAKGIATLRTSGLFPTLRVLLNPDFWLQSHPYSAAWDKELRRLMAAHKFEVVDSYTAKLGDREIWIENYPYASMRPYGNLPKVRPKRTTILAAHQKLLDDMIVGNDIVQIRAEEKA